MTVKVEIEFKNADEAIVALHKLSSVANLPPVPVEPERKARSDIGKPRKPYGPRDKEKGAGAQGGPETVVPKTETPSAGVTESRSAAAPASSTVPAPAIEARTATVGPRAVAPAPDPKSVVQSEVQALTTAADGKQATETDVASASEALAASKGLQSVIDLLARFGVKRGRDLPINRRGEYIQRAGEVAAGAAI